MKANVIIRGEPSRLGLTSHLSTSALCTAVGRNPGNLAFSYATALVLGFPPSCRHTDPISGGERIAVYTLANYLGGHYDPSVFSDFIKSAPADWRMIAVGLGAQGPLDRLSSDPRDVEIRESHIEWLRLIKDRAPTKEPCVAVRGQYTYEVLRKYGVEDIGVVTGCPSFLLSPQKELGRLIFEKFTSIGSRSLIDGALGNPWDPNQGAYELGLLKLVESAGGVVHVQMQEEHIALARGDVGSPGTELEFAL